MYDNPHWINTDQLAKPAIVDFSRAFTPKLFQKLLKRSTSYSSCGSLAGERQMEVLGKKI